LADASSDEGDKRAALKKFQNRFAGYPLKVVYEEMGNELVIVTTYPLKGKMWR